MDIWVRSQNKEVICKVGILTLTNEFNGKTFTGDWCCLVGVDGVKNILLGYFRNAKDCKKVIDDFQEHIIKTQNEFLFNCARSCAATPVNYEVFQIPEDKNV